MKVLLTLEVAGKNVTPKIAEDVDLILTRFEQQLQVFPKHGGITSYDAHIRRWEPPQQDLWGIWLHSGCGWMQAGDGDEFDSPHVFESSGDAELWLHKYGPDYDIHDGEVRQIARE